MKTLMTIGAAVLLGAISGCAGPSPSQRPTPTATPVRSPSATTQPAPTLTPTALPLPSPTATGGPVPDGFVPVAGAGLSGGTVWLLGTAPCSSPPCTSLVRSLNDGQQWVGIPAPRTPLAGYGAATGVSQVLFADAENGWAYDPELWSTHDGGIRWEQVTGLAGPVIGAAVAGDQLILEVNLGQVGQPDGIALEHGTVTQDAFATTTTLADTTAGKLTGSATGSAWFTWQSSATSGVATGLLATSNGGTTWITETPPCSGDWALGGASLALSGPDQLMAVCGGNGAAGSEAKQVLVSPDGGSQWSTVFATTVPPPGTGIEAGDLGPVAASGADAVLGTASGATELFYTTDGGASWRAATGYTANTGGTPWTSLAFLGPSQVLAVTTTGPSGGAMAGTAYLSTDAGASWKALNPRA
jgi:hypothetical protein